MTNFKRGNAHQRVEAIRNLLSSKKLLRVIEVHNGISGIIAETEKVECNGIIEEFDAMWESSLTDSLSKGKPDKGVVDMTSRILTIDQILDVTTKPIIVDCDNGGNIDYLIYTIKTLERLGVSAIIIEDKTGEKRNSLLGVPQEQENIDVFSKKIKAGKEVQIWPEFMIIARIESLILEKGLDDALIRVDSYLSAGADGIMIHSRKNSAEEVIKFCYEYKTRCYQAPLIVAPTTYSVVYESELEDAGVSIVIYANHLMRSAIPAMRKSARSILMNKRCYEIESICESISNTITMV